MKNECLIAKDGIFQEKSTFNAVIDQPGEWSDGSCSDILSAQVIINQKFSHLNSSFYRQNFSS